MENELDIIENALEILFIRQNRNTTSLSNQSLQRRNKVLDMFGTEILAQGSATSPAIFNVYVSTDLLYYERMEFKIEIGDLVTTHESGDSSMTSTVVNINSTNLSLSSENIELSGTTIEVDEASLVSPNPHSHVSSSHAHSIIPNPHSHTSPPHSHVIQSGVSSVPSTATGFRLYINSVDVTVAFQVEYPSMWITGSGIFPSQSINLNFDILRIMTLLTPEQRDNILQSHHLQFRLESQEGFFQAKLIMYIKYSHINR